MKKVELGIPGLDTVLKGGVKEGSTVLITGVPGTGKSIAAMQFIVNGALKGIPGLFITSEETMISLRENMDNIGLKIEDLEKKGMLTIVEQSITSGGMISIEAPLKLIAQKKVKRVAMDSLTLFEFVYGNSINEFRKGIISFIKQMKESGVTLIVTSERDTSEVDGMKFRPEDFLFDGLIILSMIRKGSSFERVIHVNKMRGQEHMIDVFPFKIGPGGVKVFPEQIPFSLIEQDIVKRSKK
ncbi:MAG: ATPase domain-containing protein [Nanoarchaeota archaeon]|nr:ATPase domain-containing protein [Nanoarchaeota archaeon]